MELELDEVLADVRKQAQRAKTAGYLEFKAEAVNNLYPLLESILMAVESRFDSLDDVIDAFVSEGESVIQEDLSKTILSALELGGQVCQVLAALPLDDVNKRRAVELIELYEQLATQAAQEVMEATVAAESEDDDDEEDDDDLDDDDEDEDEDDDDDDSEE